MSVKYITKRSGELQQFDINKVLQWELWGCADIKQYVDWKGIVLKVKSQFFEGMSTQDIQLKLIEEFNSRQTWYHSLVSGRLYAAYISKKIHDYLYPSVKEVQSKLVSLGYMRDMGYTDEEYDQIEKIIDHTKNYQLNYIQVYQLVNKYSLSDRVNKTQFETPQFIFMRMAMDLASDEPDRLKHVKKFYQYLSDFKINAPTPNYLNLGTNHNGYISCCLYTTSDTAESLAAGDHIAYTMTYMSAGIGGFINTRSFGDPVKGGAIRHMGKLPYYTSSAAAVNANTQGCYSEHTEILTEKGFIAFKDLTEGVKVAQVHNAGAIDFVVPEAIIDAPYKGTMYRFVSKRNMGVDIHVTPNHRMGWRRSMHVANESAMADKYINSGWKNNLQKNYYVSPNFEVTEAEDFFPTRGVVLDFGGYATGGVTDITPMDRLRIAFAADGVGRYVGDYAYTFRFTRQRKIDRLEALINELGLQYTKTLQKDGVTSFYVKVGQELKKHFRDYSLTDKNASWAKAFLREVAHWDGSLSVDTSMDCMKFSTIDPETSRFVQSLAAMCGAYSSESSYEKPNPNASRIYSVFFSFDRPYTTGRSVEKIITQYDGRVYCVTVPTGMVVIRHNGRTAVCGNSRGGACTQYFSIYDPEVTDIVYLQNPRTPITKQNRSIHFAAQFNDFFVEKAFKGEDIFTFNTYTAHDLHESIFSGDTLKFKQLYAEKEADPTFKKNYINARELAYTTLRQCHEVGTLYGFNASEVNRHTPFKEPILQSNLCVAPETLIMTDLGYKTIRDLKDQQVNVWNGKRYSEVTVHKTSEGSKLLTVKTKFGFILSATEEHKWYVMDYKSVKEVRTNELKPGMQLVSWSKPTITDSNPINFNTIYGSYQDALEFALSAQTRGFNVSIIKNDTFSFRVMLLDYMKKDEVLTVIDGGRYDETYCFTEPFEHRGVFNGILTGQCTEITQPTKPYESITDLYSTEQHDRGEISLCGLGGIIPSNVTTDEEYEDVAYYTLLMIDKCIHKNHYVFPHLEYTAKSRMNAAVGMIGVAYDLAKRGLNYTSKAGLQYLHYMGERHSYYLIKAAIRLGAERGNAAWMHKTKWPEGWLPIDTYKKDVDEGMDFEYRYDWEELRKSLIQNKGMRFSSLVAHMPTESSSKTSGLPNGVYPARAIYLKKTDGSAAIDYIVKDSDTIGHQYDIAWTHTPQQQMRYYGVIQKFADQTTSADIYSDRTNSPELKASRLLDELYWMYKYGVKTRYYTNSKTTKGVKLEDMSQERGCSGGTCTL